jgi:hypothetical protein
LRFGLRSKPFDAAFTELSAPRSLSRANRHAMQPWRDALPLLDLAGMTRQRQKSVLEGVFDVVTRAQDCATHAEDHRTVEFDQELESIGVVRRHKPLKNLFFRHRPNPQV